MANIRKFLFLDPTTGQYKEQTGNDTIQVADGVASTDAINKGQLDAASAALSAAASEATAAEQMRAEGAEAALTAAIAAEQARALAAEAVVAAAVNAEAVARQLAISSEAAARDAAIATAVSVEQGRAMLAEFALQTAIDNEASARAALAVMLNDEQVRAVAAENQLSADLAGEAGRALAAESSLSARIDAEVSAREAAVTAEATARDAAIAAAVSAEQIRALAAEAGLASDISTEADRAIAAEAVLQSNITSLSASLTSALETAISAEAATRAAADTALASDLSTETAARIAADAALASDLAAETSARSAAVSSLTSSLAAETGNRIAADSALQAAIDAEAATARAAEAALAGDLATETSARIAGDAATLAAANAHADALVAGLSFKDAVLYAIPATTESGWDFATQGSLAIPYLGVSAGDRVLVVGADDNSAAAVAGIYVVNAAGTAFERAADMAVGSSAAGAYVYVEKAVPALAGSPFETIVADPGTSFVCSNFKGSDVVGTHALSFTVYSRAESLVFQQANGLMKDGQTVKVVVKASGGVKVDADGVSIKNGDSSHIDLSNSGIALKGALVEGGNADGEHKHQVITVLAGNWADTAGKFYHAGGSAASWDIAGCAGVCSESGYLVTSGVIAHSGASAFNPNDVLYINSTGTGFVSFGDVPSGKYAVPVAKKLWGSNIMVQIGNAVLKA